MLVPIVLMLAAPAESMAQSAPPNPYQGRWVMHVPNDPDRRVFWLEVNASAGLSGTFFGATGGRMARLLDAEIHGGELRFRVERTFDGPPPRLVRAFTTARLDGDTLDGSTRIGDREHKWKGWRAPSLIESDDGSWSAGKPVKLFKPGMEGWTTLHPGRLGDWKLTGDVLTNSGKNADLLLSKQEFRNFKMHLEFRVPQGGNAGLGLRGRYEIQIFDDYGQPPDIHGNGSVYSRIAPAVNASKPPGEWQSFDITLIGRQVTVVLNGTTIIDRKQIDGLCGLATDPFEDRPGPISLQGDHGPVEYRNLLVTPLGRGGQ